jgi:hypothetical protein
VKAAISYISNNPGNGVGRKEKRKREPRKGDTGVYALKNNHVSLKRKGSDEA